MVNIKIYIEGGGDGKDLDSRFREAWTKFFKAAGLSGQMPRPVRGKGRKNTYDLFCTALEHRKSDELPLLLVDSEAALKKDHSVWQHLKSRDKWDKPNGANDEHAYLMVQVMETWLLADLEALQTYFGKNFKLNKIPAWTDLESVGKTVVFEALDKATAECGQKCYLKGKVSFEILGSIDPQRVTAKCPNSKRFLDFLAKKR